MSEQGVKNMNFEWIIHSLSVTYPDISFIVSNKTHVNANNVFMASDILGDCGGCDLNEISYLSQSCAVIMGRYSGPHTFTYIKQNLLNSEKKMISFCSPSDLYGRIPEKWSDFGTKDITTKDQHAQFFNIIGNDDKERVLEINKIIES